MSDIMDIIEGKVKVCGKEIDLVGMFYIDDTNILEEFAKQAALFAYFSTLQADAEKKVSQLSFDKDKEYAATDSAWREFYDQHNKKYTEAVIKAHVLQDDDFSNKTSELINAEYEASILKAVVRALQMRAEMLVSLGAHLRQEYAMTGISVNEKSFDDAVNNVKELMKRSAK